MLLKKNCAWCDQAFTGLTGFTITTSSRTASSSSLHSASERSPLLNPSKDRISTGISENEPTIFLCFFSQEPSTQPRIEIVEGYHVGCLLFGAYQQNKNLLAEVGAYARQRIDAVASISVNTAPNNYQSASFNFITPSNFPSDQSVFHQSCKSFMLAKQQQVSSRKIMTAVRTFFNLQLSNLLANDNLTVHAQGVKQAFPKNWMPDDVFVEVNGHNKIFLAFPLPDPPSRWHLPLCCGARASSSLRAPQSAWQPIFSAPL